MLFRSKNYMSPYTQGVVDIALREAERDRDIARQREKTAATQSGAFGGYRQGVVEAEDERNYNQSLNDITTKGYQDAYNAAVAQFQADRAAKLGAEQNNQANALAAYQANEAAKQQAAQLGMAATSANAANDLAYYGNKANVLGSMITGAQGLGSLATARQAADIATQNALKGYSADAQAQGQATIDAFKSYWEEVAKAQGLTPAQYLASLIGLNTNNPSNTQISVKS